MPALKHFWILVLCLIFLLLSACRPAQEEDSAIVALVFEPSYHPAQELTVGERSEEHYFTIVTTYETFFWDIEFVSTDESIAVAQYEKTAGDIYVYYTIEAIAAGEAYVYFTADDGRVESERIRVTVTEKVEERDPKDTDFEGTEPEGETTETETLADKTESKIVYVTPSGKRYHYSKSCAGKNAQETSLDEAIAAGKTPCGTCARN